MVGSLVRERAARRDRRRSRWLSTWGRSQILGGPVLIVPYLQHGKDEKGKGRHLDLLHASFLPETLKVEGRIEPERRSRGIFELVVYRADLRWTGAFERPSFEAWASRPRTCSGRMRSWRWECRTCGASAPPLKVDWAGEELPWSPGGAEDGLWSLRPQVRFRGWPGARPGSVRLRLRPGLNGSQALQFLPLGKQTSVELKSAWPDPKFTGSFLPKSREVSGPVYGPLGALLLRPQLPATVAAGGGLRPGARSEPSGLRLRRRAVPAGGRLSEDRAVDKVLGCFPRAHVSDLLSLRGVQPVQLHPLQYLLVGAALCLFYLLLLSISEHAPFAPAYLVAAAATVLLIGGYSAAILRGRLRALVMTGVAGAPLRLPLRAPPARGLRPAPRVAGALRHPGAGDVRDPEDRLVGPAARRGGDGAGDKRITNRSRGAGQRDRKKTMVVTNELHPLQPPPTRRLSGVLYL